MDSTRSSSLVQVMPSLATASDHGPASRLACHKLSEHVPSTQRVWLSPQSQSFFRRYGSDMPISLTYIILVPVAVHLGNLMQIRVRTATKIVMPPSGFQGPTRALQRGFPPRTAFSTSRPLDIKHENACCGTLYDKPL